MEKLFIVLDISNESIGGSLCTKSITHDTRIIHSIRLPIVWEQPATTAPLLIKIKQTLQNVIKQLHDTGIPIARKQGVVRSVISNVFVTYASPWYLSQTKKVNSNYTKPLAITHNLLKELIAVEEKQFLEETKNHTHSTLYNNVKIIERRIIDIKLNGYSTKSPYNKKASTVEISIHTSFVSEDILRITTNALDGYFNCRTIKYFSFPLIAYTAFTHMEPEESNYVLLDIRGETTDVSLVKNGILWETISFPIGTGAILRYISENTNTSVHIAQSLIHIYDQRKPITDIIMSLEPKLKHVGEEWLNGYNQAVKELTDGQNIPKQIVCLVPNYFEKHTKKILKQNNPHTHIKIIHAYDCSDWIPSFTKHSDTALALETYIASQTL